MKVVKRRQPADFIRDPLSSDRIERIWQGLDTREYGLAKWRRSKQLAVALAVTACAAALVLFLFRKPPAPPAGAVAQRAGSVLEAPKLGEQLLLPDGSEVRLANAARARVLELSAREVRLRLERGWLTCDVEPRAERRFVVEVRDIEVSVKGTEFTVSLEANGSAVTVSVARGLVEVRDRTRLIASLE
ncbi:MAG TPA: FecR family protein, partial [Polyangiaceae bacterium]|nr:FecR family protein [Polyangiaceae bacterium]